MKTFFRLAAVTIGSFLLTTLAWGDTVNFNEVSLSSGYEFTGYEYSAYNLVLTNTYFGIDPVFTEDGQGIAEYPNPATIGFIRSVTGLQIDWVAVNTPFFATAYDVYGNVLDTYSAAACGGICYGVASLSGNHIAKVVWHDDAGYVGIDSLTFTVVPEPSAIALLLALLSVPVLFRRKLARFSVQ